MSAGVTEVAAESLTIYDHDHQHALSGQVVPLVGGEEEKKKAAGD